MTIGNEERDLISSIPVSYPDYKRDIEVIIEYDTDDPKKYVILEPADDMSPVMIGIGAVLSIFITIYFLILNTL